MYTHVMEEASSASIRKNAFNLIHITLLIQMSVKGTLKEIEFRFYMQLLFPKVVVRENVLVLRKRMKLNNNKLITRHALFSQ